MTNHSLHPWRFKADGPGWTVLDADGGRVARISEIDKTDLRLMVAAPELLAFAIEYLWAEHGICAQSDEASCLSPEQLRDRAVEVLAKAKGDSHGPQ